MKNRYGLYKEEDITEVVNKLYQEACIEVASYKYNVNTNMVYLSSLHFLTKKLEEYYGIIDITTKNHNIVCNEKVGFTIRNIKQWIKVLREEGYKYFGIIIKDYDVMVLVSIKDIPGPFVREMQLLNNDKLAIIIEKGVSKVLSKIKPFETKVEVIDETLYIHAAVGIDEPQGFNYMKYAAKYTDRIIELVKDNFGLEPNYKHLYRAEHFGELDIVYKIKGKKDSLATLLRINGY